MLTNEPYCKVLPYFYIIVGTIFVYFLYLADGVNWICTWQRPNL